MGILHKLGLTMRAKSYLGVLWGSALFPIAIYAAFVSTVYFVKSPYSDQAIEMMPVSVDKIPGLVIVGMIVLANASGIFAIFGIMIFQGRYANDLPRKMKGPELADSSPTLFRLQSAHNNTLEALSYVTAAFWVAFTYWLEPVLFAKLALYILACRILYVVFYVLDEDFLRSSAFVFAFTAIVDIAAGPLFPEALAKYK